MPTVSFGRHNRRHMSSSLYRPATIITQSTADINIPVDLYDECFYVTGILLHVFACVSIDDCLPSVKRSIHKQDECKEKP